MRKIRTLPRHRTTRICPIDDDLRYDDLRRLRNALLALAQLDPGWMYWIERNISKSLPLYHARLQVERRARALVANRYAFLGPSRWFVTVYGDYFFTDDACLRMTL